MREMAVDEATAPWTECVYVEGSVPAKNAGKCGNFAVKQAERTR